MIPPPDVMPAASSGDSAMREPFPTFRRKMSVGATLGYTGSDIDGKRLPLIGERAPGLSDDAIHANADVPETIPTTHDACARQAHHYRSGKTRALANRI